MRLGSRERQSGEPGGERYRKRNSVGTHGGLPARPPAPRRANVVRARSGEPYPASRELASAAGLVRAVAGLLRPSGAARSEATTNRPSRSVMRAGRLGVRRGPEQHGPQCRVVEHRCSCRLHAATAAVATPVVHFVRIGSVRRLSLPGCHLGTSAQRQ